MVPLEERMFNDDYSDENEGLDPSEQEIEAYKLSIEREFFQALERKENLSSYLYLPNALLSQRVKDHLDIILLEEAYKNLFELQEETWTVYKDGHLTILISEDSFKEELLQRMIVHFSAKEEYEKCAKIKNQIDNLKHIK